MSRRSDFSDNRLWPTFGNRADAQQAMKGGVIAAAFVAVVNIGIGAWILLSGPGHAAPLGASGSVVVDGTIFAVLGVFLYRHSLVAAWISLILFTFEKIWQWTTQPNALFGVIVGILLWLAFLHALRGAMALRQFERAALEPPAFTEMP
ncbi:hypothetical protein KPL74_11340 [Bacillus sp. NP157]|nr:hypothetical protein KPL74_11340 [Bacillus sp. NP157]